MILETKQKETSPSGVTHDGRALGPSHFELAKTRWKQQPFRVEPAHEEAGILQQPDTSRVRADGWHPGELVSESQGVRLDTHISPPEARALAGRSAKQEACVPELLRHSAQSLAGAEVLHLHGSHSSGPVTPAADKLTRSLGLGQRHPRGPGQRQTCHRCREKLSFQHRWIVTSEGELTGGSGTARPGAAGAVSRGPASQHGGALQGLREQEGRRASVDETSRGRMEPPPGSHTHWREPAGG